MIQRFATITLILVAVLQIVGCASSGARGSGPRPAGGEAPGASGPSGSAPTTPGPTSRRGGFYMDDGPGENPPADLATVPDAVPRREALNPRNARPYVVFGRQYTPMSELAPYTERGMASWYGRKFHGQRTANGEVYDMYAMTAAHPTAPIPSYARVTNLNTGRSVVVRINDRGPFLNNRVIDLSYTAAFRLGYVEAGSAPVQVELIHNPGEPSMQVATAPPAVAPPLVATPVTTVPQTSQSAPAPAATVVTAAESREPRLVLETQVDIASGGHVLQLGAFASRDNAQTALSRLSRQLEHLGLPLSIRSHEGLFRVVAGPYSKREEAAAANERIRASTELRPVLRSQ
jgi:rare lipoprotein A